MTNKNRPLHLKQTHNPSTSPSLTNKRILIDKVEGLLRANDVASNNSTAKNRLVEIVDDSKMDKINFTVTKALCVKSQILMSTQLKSKLLGNVWWRCTEE